MVKTYIIIRDENVIKALSSIDPKSCREDPSAIDDCILAYSAFLIDLFREVRRRVRENELELPDGMDKNQYIEMINQIIKDIKELVGESSTLPFEAKKEVLKMLEEVAEFFNTYKLEEAVEAARVALPSSSEGARDAEAEAKPQA